MWRYIRVHPIYIVIFRNRASQLKINSETQRKSITLTIGYCSAFQGFNHSLARVVVKTAYRSKL